jgi:hypothetical protein
MLRSGDILKSEPAGVSHTLDRAFSATRMYAGHCLGRVPPPKVEFAPLALTDKLTF